MLPTLIRDLLFWSLCWNIMAPLRSWRNVCVMDLEPEFASCICNEISRRAEFASRGKKKKKKKSSRTTGGLIIPRSCGDLPPHRFGGLSIPLGGVIRGRNLPMFGIAPGGIFGTRLFSGCYNIPDGLTDGSANSPGAR